jgi:hypothetical protein
MGSNPDDDFDRKCDLLKHELDRAEALQKGFQGANNTSASHITVSMGGGSVAVWVCVTCVIVSLIAIAFIARDVSEVKQNDRDQMHQMNAIYQYAPNLKPKEPTK